MSVASGVRARLRALLFRAAANRELAQEIQFHIELEMDKNLRLGYSREEARRLAIAHFGGVQRVREEHRDVRRLRVIENLATDVRFAIRGLRRTPGLAIACIVCIVIIALGVGANGAMFSFADRLFTRPPSGVSDPGGLRRLYARTNFSIGDLPVIGSGFPYRVYALLDSALAPRLQMAGYTPPDTTPMIVGDSHLQVHGSYVTGGYMRVLGVRPSLGRFFTRDEEIPGTPVHVAVISDRFWRRAFHGDTSAVGSSVVVDRQRATIVGIAPRGFDGPDLNATDIWMPLPSFPRQTTCGT